MNIKGLYILFVLSLATLNLYGVWEIRSVNVENGLAQSSVYTVCQDTKGIMWMGTGDGFSRFDGSNIINYSPGNVIDNHCIGGKGVHNIFCVNDSELLICHEKGIDMFNVYTGLFNHIIRANYPNVICYRSPYLLYQLYKKGFYSLNTINKKNTHVFSIIQTLVSGASFVKGDECLLVDKKGMLTVLNLRTYKCNRFSMQNNQDVIYRFDKLSENIINVTSTSGNCVFDIKKHQFLDVKKYIPISFLDKKVVSYLKDSQGNKWWSIEGSGIYLQTYNNAFQKITKNDNGYSENAKEVYKFYEDKENNIWACTEGSGVWIIYNKSNHIVKIPEYIKNNKRFKIGPVFGLTSDVNSSVFYAGTFRNGIFNVDTNGLINEIPVKTNIADIHNRIIRTICVADPSTLLIGTENGLYVLDKTTGIVQLIELPIELTDIMYIKCCGINKYVIGTNASTAIVRMIKKHIDQIDILKYRDTLFATRFIYALKDGRYILIRNNNYPLLLKVLTDNVYSLREIYINEKAGLMGVAYSHRRYWWATKNGLIETDTSGKYINRYTTKDGVSNDFMYTVVDDNNYLWLSSNKGLTRFNVKNKKSFNYNLDDGLQSYEFNTNAFALLAQKYLAFGGANGLNLINTNVKITNAFKPSVILSGLKINDSSYLDPLKLLKVRHVQLNYNQNNIEIAAMPVNYTNLHYSIGYQLKGLDKEWFTSLNGVLRYNHLEPGHYTLLGKFMHVEDENASAFEILDINILPPFWQKWWFYLFCIFFTIGILYSIIYFVSTRKLRLKLAEIEKQRTLEQIRSRISRDIHDDIGSGLTKIALQSELLKQQLVETNARSKAGLLAESSKELISNLSNVIWSINPRHDNLQGLIAYMREYTHDYLEPFNIDVNIAFPDVTKEIVVHPELRRNLFMILKESLHNIVKYSNAKNVYVSFNYTSDTYSLTIKDDGVGFDISNTRYFGNGLLNMKKRASMSKSEFKIDSVVGEGTVITINGVLTTDIK